MRVTTNLQFQTLSTNSFASCLTTLWSQLAKLSFTSLVQLSFRRLSIRLPQTKPALHLDFAKTNNAGSLKQSQKSTACHLQLDPPFLPHGNGLFTSLSIVSETGISQFSTWTMTLTLMFPPSEDITGAELTATNSILTYIQEEKQALNCLTMTVTVSLVSTIAVDFTKTNSVLLINASVSQLSAIQQELTSLFLKSISMQAWFKRELLTTCFLDWPTNLTYHMNLATLDIPTHLMLHDQCINICVIGTFATTMISRISQLMAQIQTTAATTFLPLSEILKKIILS